VNISGQLVFFRASASCSKTLNDKNISIQRRISGQLAFFRASASCSKILNDEKYIFNTMKHFRATHAFLSKCKLLKNPQW